MRDIVFVLYHHVLAQSGDRTSIMAAITPNAQTKTIWLGWYILLVDASSKEGRNYYEAQMTSEELWDFLQDAAKKIELGNPTAAAMLWHKR
jgi:hypothetical protein